VRCKSRCRRCKVLTGSHRLVEYVPGSIRVINSDFGVMCSLPFLKFSSHSSLCVKPIIKLEKEISPTSNP
jgi:hypothetical protein